MFREYNIYQVNCFLFDTKVVHLSVSSLSCPLHIHMYYDHKLMFGIQDDNPLYKEMLKQPLISITAYRSDGKWLTIHGHIVFEEQEKYAWIAKKRSPTLTRYCNEITHIQLKMFHFEKAQAFITDEFHNTYKADIR